MRPSLRALFDSHSHSARIYTSKVKAFTYGASRQDPPSSALFSLVNPINHVPLVTCRARPHSPLQFLHRVSSSSQRHQLPLKTILLTTTTLSPSSLHELTFRPTRSLRKPTLVTDSCSIHDFLTGAILAGPQYSHLDPRLAHRRHPYHPNTTKLAGTHSYAFSYARPLLGPGWFVCGGDIKQPP